MPDPAQLRRLLLESHPEVWVDHLLSAFRGAYFAAFDEAAVARHLDRLRALSETCPVSVAVEPTGAKPNAATLATGLPLVFEAAYATKKGPSRDKTLASARKLLESMPDDAAKVPPHPRPKPMPDATQRQVEISVTGLDRLRGDPYQFYASSILGLRRIDALDAEPSAAWKGEVAQEHSVRWPGHGPTGLCPPHFTVGERFIVYVSAADRGPEIRACSRFAAGERVPDERRELGPPIRSYPAR